MKVAFFDKSSLAPVEESFSFETYKNYVRSLSRHLTDEYGVPPFAALRQALDSQQLISPGSHLTYLADELDQIRRLLFNAWNTEIVLSIPRTVSAEFTKYANHWSPVQTYYSIYLAAMAYFKSRQSTSPKSHSAALSMLAADITDGKTFPSPWRVYCSGHSHLTGIEYANTPNGAVVKPLNPLSVPGKDDFWSSFGMLLRTTRERQCQRILKESAKHFKTGKGKPRKRLTGTQKKGVLQKIRPTTLFDFLYRLRLRSNYDDADAFILGSTNSSQAAQFNNALCEVTAATLFVLEMQIASRLGPKMTAYIDAFMKADSGKYSGSTIGARKPFLA